MSGIKQGELIDGRYRIESRLGTGGMADVFLAEDQQLERQIALKLLHRRFAEDPGFVERFRREAQSAASLQHPNVVSVFDRGSWDGTYYIAMEYLQGRTLKQLIRDDAPLDAVRAIDITVQILKAIRFAHRRGVIHRDLKPHNVMIDDQDHVKVTDFGIARAGASDMTETGSIMGTAQYLSPEQAQGLAVAEASDLYSIGIVLYELVTGRVPFDAESAVTIALKHVSESPPPPSRFNPSLPPALEQTVLWALNKNPADRPQDADQFIGVLEGIREHLAAGDGTQATASMTALGIGAAGAAAALGAAAAADALAAENVGARPRVQLGTHSLAYPSTVMQPPPGDSGALPVVEPVAVGPEPEGSRPWDGIWPWLLALLVLALIGGGIAAYELTRPSTSTVPVVVNLTQGAATSKLEAAGFNPQVIPQASTAPSGTVIYQSPLGGTRANSGSSVDLTVSSGPGSTTVPPVVEDTRSQAIYQLKLKGLKVSKILSEASSTVPKGKATRTDPDAGTSLQTGQAVVLYLSSGVAPIAVPTVTGDSLSTAQTALSNFKVKVDQRPSTSQSPGTVLSQSPAGGANALPGSTVTLVVAEKQPTVTVANVVGQSAAQASATLSGLGLNVKQTSQRTNVRADNNMVLSQTPGGNTKVPAGSTVTVTVGRYVRATTTTSTSTTASHTATSTTATTATSTSTTPTATTTTTTNGIL